MTTTEPFINHDAPPTRRSLLGKGAIAAAAAATAGLAVSRTASAADGDPLNVGAANTGSADTALGGGSSFVVTDGTSNGFDTGAGVMPASIVAKQATKGGFGIVGEYTGTDPGIGVIAVSNKGLGLVGRGTEADLEADGSGKVILNKDAFGGAAPTGAGVVGTLGRDVDGSLWYSPKTATWIKLASAASAGGAGTFHVISPVRVYDSRLGLPTPGKLASGQNRVVSIKDARSETTGAVTTADVVPAGAVAVVANLTVTLTEGELGGFLSVVPGDATALSGSSINWSGPDQNIANGLTAKIAADRTVKVFCGGAQAPKTHFVIDISGYWM